MVYNSFEFNNASSGGGAYINTVPVQTLQGNYWDSNTAAIGAGALDMQTVKSGDITSDVYTRNSGQQGGAIFQTASTSNIFNTTFSVLC